MTPTIHIMWVPAFAPERDKNVKHVHDTYPGKLCPHTDPLREGVTANFLKAVECALHDDSEWSLIMQDDGIPINGWLDHLEPALDNSPSSVVMLSHCGGYGRSVRDKGKAYGVNSTASWGVAVAYRKHALQMILELGALGIPDAHDDCLTLAYGQISGEGVAMTARALFDHDPAARSLLGHGGQHRYPKSTIREPGPDWTEGSVTVNAGWKRDSVKHLVEAWRDTHG